MGEKRRQLWLKPEWAGGACLRLFSAAAFIYIVYFSGWGSNLLSPGSSVIYVAATLAVSSSDIGTVVQKIKLKDVDGTTGTERRLRILFALAVRDEISFSDLSAAIEASPGATSQEVSRLEKKGLIKPHRVFLENGVRRTTYTLTDKGRKDLQRLLDAISSCKEYFQRDLENPPEYI
jgi:DNA-binding MarR family transcriptional regulator